jgi:hypothetical protein
VKIDDGLEETRLPSVIGVEKCHEVAGCHAHTQVARSRHSAILGGHHLDTGVRYAASHIATAVSGTIINDDHLFSLT